MTWNAGRLRRATWLVVALAAAAHVVELYQFTYFEFDKMNHVSATWSALAGRGFTIPAVGPCGLADRTYAPLRGFPPGYAFALLPLLRLTHDPVVAPFLLDCLATIVFLLAWTAVLKAFDRTNGLYAPLLLGMWTVLYSPIATQTYSDLLAAALFAAGFALGLAALRGRGALVLVAGIGSGALVGASCIVRYAYWPLIIVVPLALLAVRRDRRTTAAAFASLAVAAAAVAWTTFFMWQTTGETTFLTRWYPEASRGLFWRQLLRMYPFPSAALGLDRVFIRLAHGRRMAEAMAPGLLWLISAYVLALAIAHLWAVAAAAFRRECDGTVVYVTVGGVVTVAATLAMLIGLSVRLPAVADGWTVVMESRYYMMVLPFIALWFVGSVIGPWRVTPALRYSAATVLIVSVLVAGLFRAARMEQYFVKNRSTSWLAAARRHEARRLTSLLNPEPLPSQPPVFVDDDIKWRGTVATMAGALRVSSEQFSRAGEPDAAAGALVAVPDPHDRSTRVWREAIEHGTEVLKIDGATLYRLPATASSAAPERPCGSAVRLTAAR